MKALLAHLFLPRESNNHRAKALHHDSLFFILGVFCIVQLLFTSFSGANASVLGTATSITTHQLLNYTNQHRKQAGKNPLVLNPVLSEAAELKAQDMFAKNYWAHNSPDGLTPWVFFRRVDYDYQYAGENLARGFTSSKDVVDAWMASPSHKENLLSSNYKEIGFAVEDGSLTGETTTLVVQEFGSTQAAPMVKTQDTTQSKTAQSPVYTETERVSGAWSFAPQSSFRYILTFIIGAFVVLFVIDIIVIERKKIVRLAGHSQDHAMFLVVILFFVLLFSKGAIL